MGGKEIQVPFIVHEAAIARMERTNKRLLIALLVAIITIFASNAMWLYMWNQYDYVGETDTVTLETRDGTANYIGNDGDINYGENNGDAQD